jgi:triosephosphate isomerase (TIM)
MTRKPLIAGNWKMNLTVDVGSDVAHKLAAALTPDLSERVDIVVLPPFPLLGAVRAVLAAEAPSVMCGAQDLSPHDSGAYTGDVSGAMLTSVGCRYVVVGHSERRQHHGEDDATVNSKVHAALRNGLTPIVCVGEGLDVREQGRHVEHSTAQLEADLAQVPEEQLASVVIAYEPVWAIGTGRVASAADAQEVCGAIRQAVAVKYGEAIAAGVRVLYGGSVKAENVGEIVAQPDIDGALVGGASLDADGFSALCRASAPSR